ncbi:lipoprotein LprG [Thermocatellispora tengchongensis]|uniref:Lipoprotein LprG n=1 Tax=Thermocatellispora tengchongensis TaxID=1073253 RepID=A0A840P2X9_9ACTN|nr:LppX_LprAFG lipoprotein [Thermocatellispora tengchongensis]MBB5131830.1 lipoprotein LprG [Thermocatellispora tengchongensis]
MWLRRTLRLLVPIAAAMLLASACTGGDDGGGAALPTGPEVLKKASEAMRAVKSAAFTIETEGKPPVPVRKADGRLTARGDADGTIQIEILGNLQELKFVLIGSDVHFKGPTGGFQKMSKSELAAIYDPSAILSADKGVPALLAAATDAVTQAEENVGDSPAYRVAATLPQEKIAVLVPGIQQGVNGTLWVDKASSRLVKASLPLGTGDASGTVTVTLRDYDAPVELTAPQG